MKSRITQGDVARKIGIDQGSVSRILNRDTRDSFSEDTVKKVFKIAREMGYLHPALLTTNRRMSARRRTLLKAHLRIIVGTNTVYDEGQVEIHEISESGCLLKGFKTAKRNLPLDRFKFDLEVNEPRMKNFHARCRLIRFSDNEEEFALAVEFEGLSMDRKDKLRGFLK